MMSLNERRLTLTPSNHHNSGDIRPRQQLNDDLWLISNYLVVAMPNLYWGFGIYTIYSDFVLKESYRDCTN